MTTSTRAETGTYGEQLAGRVLVDSGYTILERNWRCRHGEIDLVARDGDALVIVEVKTRRGVTFGDPVEAVTFDKMLRLRRLAVAWLEEHPGSGASAIRIDVIGVLLRPGGPAQVRHVRGELT